MGQLICTEKCVDNRPAFTAAIPIMWTVSDAGYGISLLSKGREHVKRKKKKKKKGKKGKKGEGEIEIKGKREGIIEMRRNGRRDRCKTTVETRRTPVT